MKRGGLNGMRTMDPFRILLFHYEQDAETVITNNLVALWVKFYVKTCVYTEVNMNSRKCKAYVIKMMKEQKEVFGTQRWNGVLELDPELL